MPCYCRLPCSRVVAGSPGAVVSHRRGDTGVTPPPPPTPQRRQLSLLQSPHGVGQWGEAMQGHQGETHSRTPESRSGSPKLGGGIGWGCPPPPPKWSRGKVSLLPIACMGKLRHGAAVGDNPLSGAAGGAGAPAVGWGNPEGCGERLR